MAESQRRTGAHPHNFDEESILQSYEHKIVELQDALDEAEAEAKDLRQQLHHCNAAMARNEREAAIFVQECNRQIIEIEEEKTETAEELRLTKREVEMLRRQETKDTRRLEQVQESIRCVSITLADAVRLLLENNIDISNLHGSLHGMDDEVAACVDEAVRNLRTRHPETLEFVDLVDDPLLPAKLAQQTKQAKQVGRERQSENVYKSGHRSGPADTIDTGCEQKRPADIEATGSVTANRAGTCPHAVSTGPPQPLDLKNSTFSDGPLSSSLGASRASPHALIPGHCNWTHANARFFHDRIRVLATQFCHPLQRSLYLLTATGVVLDQKLDQLGSMPDEKTSRAFSIRTTQPLHAQHSEDRTFRGERRELMAMLKTLQCCVEAIRMTVSSSLQNLQNLLADGGPFRGQAECSGDDNTDNDNRAF